MTCSEHAQIVVIFPVLGRGSEETVLRLARLPKSAMLGAWLPLHTQFTSSGKRQEQPKRPPGRERTPHPGAAVQRRDMRG